MPAVYALAACVNPYIVLLAVLLWRYQPTLHAVVKSRLAKQAGGRSPPPRRRRKRQ